MKEVDFLLLKLKETEKFDVRVVIETRGFGEQDWEKMIISYHELTLDQRDELIEELRNDK